MRATGTPFLAYATRCRESKLAAGRIGEHMFLKYRDYQRAFVDSVGLARALHENLEEADDDDPSRVRQAAPDGAAAAGVAEPG